MHTIYENFVLENKIEDMLLTNVDMNNYITADYSLSENAGMKKIINTYTAEGDVEELAMGEGNTAGMEVSFTPKEYEVGVTQGFFSYYDEQEMTDPMVVEVGLKKIAATMTNDLTTKAIGALAGATLTHEVTDWDFESVVDAISLYPYENEEGLFLIINPAQKAAFRKNLKDDLKYVEGFSRTGYIGTVCNVAVIVSKACPEHVGLLATKEAVTCFIKKGVEMEQERDANHRKNDIYARKVMLVALTDATRVIKLYDGEANFPNTSNDGLKVALSGDNTFKVTGKAVTAGVADTDVFPGLDGEPVVEITFPALCKVGSYNIKQVNPALEYYKDDAYVEETEEGWVKDKDYTFTEPEEYSIILKEGKGVATIDADGVVYTVKYNFTCA